MSIAKLYTNEAERLSLYLIGKPCNSNVTEGYADAVTKLDMALTPVQEQTYKRMVGWRFYMRAIDGGLAFTNRESVLRKRIFVMLCLLESSKYNTEYFLPRKRSPFYFFGIGFNVAYAFFTAIIGVLIIKLNNIE